MSDKHTIDHAVLELAFGSQSHAMAQDGSLGLILKGTLLPIIDEVVHTVSDTREGQIDHLCIDLGVMNYTGFQGEMASRLRSRLKAELERILQPNQSASPSTVQTSKMQYPTKRGKPSQEASLETLLVQGQWPKLPASEKRRIEQWVSEAIASDGPKFVNFLKQSPDYDIVVKRLALQCSDQTLHKIAQRLSTGTFILSISLIKKLEETLRVSRLVQVGEDKIKALIWEVIFHQLLKSRSESFSIDKLVDRLIERSTDQFNLSTVEALKDLGNRLKTSVRDTQELPQDSLKNAADHRMKTPHPRGSEMTQMRSLLMKAISVGEPTSLMAIWSKICSVYPQLLKEVFFQTGKRVAVRKALALGFPESMLKDMVRLIEPEASGFIQDLIARTSLFQSILPGQFSKSVRVQALLWEWTFGYLIFECASGFHKKDFISSLLSQMALEYQTPYPLLLRTLKQAFEKQALSPRGKSDLPRLLKQLLNALPNVEDWRKIDHISTSTADTTIEAFGQYEKLSTYLLRKAALNEGNDANENLDAAHAVALIRLLHRAHPEQLLRLYRRLQASFRSWENIGTGIPTRVLHQLIQSFLSLSPHENLVPADLLEAIEKYARTAKDINTYYQQILSALIQNQAIDFEAIHQFTPRTPQTETVSNDKESPSVLHQDKRASAEIATLKRQVSDAIREGRPEALQALWPELIQNEPEIIRSVLFSLGKNAGMLNTLAQSFPDAMLRDIVDLIEPAASAFVYALVSSPIFNQHEALLRGVEVGKIKAKLWAWNLATLLRTQHFDRTRYLDSLIRRIAVEQKIDAGDLLRSLTEACSGLKKRSAPSNTLMHSLRALSEAAQNQLGRTEEDKQEHEATVSKDLYSRLKALLLQGQSPPMDIILALSQLHPGQLRQVFRDLQSEATPGTAFLRGFSTEGLKKIIAAFVSHETKGVKDKFKDFAQAISIYAQKAKNEQNYYRRILIALIENTPIDFEKMIEEISNQKGMAPRNSSDEQADNRTQINATARLSLSNTQFKTLEDALETQEPWTYVFKQRFSDLIDHLLARDPERLSALLLRHLQKPETAARLIATLNEKRLARLLRFLHPQGLNALAQTADIIATACFSQDCAIDPTGITKLKWAFIYRYLFEERRPIHAKLFISLFSAFLAKKTQASEPKQFYASLCQPLLLNILPSTKASILEIVSILTAQAEEEALLEPMPPHDLSVDDAKILNDAEPNALEELYIYNAGMVLAVPYLERLFSILDLSGPSAFKSRRASERAVHLLEYLVNTETETPEYRLVLNKILCGIKPGRPIIKGIEIRDKESTAIEGLLEGIISHWKQLGNTSIQGLRESFLQREGHLHRSEKGWELSVQPKPYDMLLDQLPWSFSIIKLPWMEQTLYVKWR